MKNKRLYELIYLVDPTATEQEVTDLHSQVEATVARFEATLSKSENWGRRKLAYQIAGHKEATYVLELIEGSGELMKEIERRLKVNEQVLRNLIVRVDEELHAAERSRSRRQADAERRAARTGRPAGQGQPRPEASEGLPGEDMRMAGADIETGEGDTPDTTEA
ncbi:MAG: 30S ribosomal protein S6 [Acidobacteria bacterium]|nr:MAG: 30S ribosomal protein S6 [Acidobacteriota bacterium]